MRERGRQYAFRVAGLLGGLAAVVCVGAVAGSGHIAPLGIRSIVELVVPPAQAGWFNKRRSGRSGKEADRTTEAALKQEQARQAEAAQRQLQEAQAAQRIQQMQEAAAAQQARMQQLQALQMEAQKRQHDATRHHGFRPAAVQPSPNAPASSPRLIAAEQRRAAIEETMAKLRGHHGPQRLEQARQEAPRPMAASHHQAVLEQTLAKLRGRHHPQQDASRSRRDNDVGAVGRHHQALLDKVTANLHRSNGNTRYDNRFGHDERNSRNVFGDNRDKWNPRQAMDRFRDRRRDGGRDHDDRHGNDWNKSRQYAVYSYIHKKLSGSGWHWHAKNTKKPEPTPAPTTTTTTATTTTGSRTASTGTRDSSLLPNASNTSDVVAPIVSKLPDVVSTVTKTASADTSTSDSSMSRLGGPKPAGDDKETGKAKGAKKDNDDSGASDDNNGGVVRRVIGDLRRGAAGALLPPQGSFKTDEILAVNLSAAGLRQALDRNFRVIEQVDYPALGISVTRLATPDNQNALIGRSTLNEMLPSEGFGLNHIYMAGRSIAVAPVPSGTDDGGKGGVKSAALSNIPPPNTGTARRVTGGPCPSDRCFGATAINWRPQLGTCARDVKIGMIDTGIDKSHPAFAHLVATERFAHQDFVEGKQKPTNQHGTGVFSLLAGDPRSSTPGLVSDARFFVGDAFFADRNGNAMSNTTTMLRALNWLKQNRVDVANLSFAGPSDELVHDAIRKLAMSGTVILAAAGNEGPDAPPSYPAGYEEVVAVTAVDRNLAPYTYANRGKYIDVAAPGVDVWTALPNRREGPQTGTSFAVPFAASVVALNYRAASPADALAPKARALALLHQNIKPIGGRGNTATFGAGLIQAPMHCESVPVASGWGTVQVAPVVPVVNHNK